MKPTITLLKQYEDSIEALVCACIGCRYIEGYAEVYGDIEGAVRVPS